MSGRPLRFLGATVALWTLCRIAILLPSEADHVLTVTRAAAVRGPAPSSAPSPVPSPIGHIVAGRDAVARSDLPVPAGRAPDGHAMTAPGAYRSRPAPPIGPARPIPSVMAMTRDASPSPSPPADPYPKGIPASPPLAERPGRWSASLWGVLRDGGGGELLPGGQLGGAQAGMRLLRRLDGQGAVSASLRFSAPLRGIGREMALGIDWAPIRHVPVRLLIERRVALDAGPGGTAMLAVTGIGPRPIGRDLTVTAYAQGGGVARSRIEPFADGAVRIGREIASGLDLGIGMWGGAQRDARRLDVGPTMGVAVPVAGRPVRLSLDWRQRIAGAAAPDSGPALSLAGDF